MDVLLDTHALIWFAEGNERLSVSAKRTILDEANSKFLSVASLWEIVIKTSLQKLELKQTFVEINQFLAINDIKVIGIKTEHLNHLLELPHYHGDPFDRLLIAQAITQNLTVISADRHFIAYAVSVIL